MSWQSAVFNLIFRAQKPGLRKCNFEQAKASMTKTMAQAEKSFKLPADIQLQTQKINGVNCDWVMSEEAQSSERVILYFHGGAFMVGSPPVSHCDMAVRLSRDSGMKVLLVDYRLTPEHVFPAQLDDATAVYKWLLDNGYSANNIAFAGDSAGGNMTLSVIIKAQQNNIPLPFAGICLSPWADLTHVGESVTFNKDKDPMLPINILINAADVYAQGHDPSDPLISPVFADFNGFPPLLVYAGSTEVLLSDAERIVEKATAAGVDVEYKYWRKQAHAFPVIAQFLPEGKQAITAMADFLKRKAIV
jgi:acetyl esterase/lipase